MRREIKRQLPLISNSERIHRAANFHLGHQVVLEHDFAQRSDSHTRRRSRGKTHVRNTPERDYSTVTLFARLRGLSTSVPRASAA